MTFIKKITPYLLITIAIATLYACKKSDSPTPTPTPVIPVETIYTAGYERSANGVGHYVAKYWKDSTAVDLTDGTNDAQAKAMAREFFLLKINPTNGTTIGNNTFFNFVQ